MFNEETTNNKINEFIKQLRANGTYASDEELMEALKGFSIVMRNHKDSNLSEIATALLEDVLDEINVLIDQGYAIPGMLVGINTPMFNFNIASGNTRESGKPINSQTLFDLASITKLYTGVIAYKLIDEGILLPEQKVTDIYADEKPKFDKLSDDTVGSVTVRDIMQFRVKFETPGRLDDAMPIAEARERLYGTKVAQIGSYNYNDIGMMILKEIMEKVTGKTYAELFREYITIPLSLRDTYLSIPDNKKRFVTGTPNIEPEVRPNDLKAIAVGSSGGHAGVFATSDDSFKFTRNLWVNTKYFKPEYLKDFYTPNTEIHQYRGFYGSTYTPHIQGRETSFVDKLHSATSFAVQGSTRTEMTTGIFTINKEPLPFGTTIYMNPCSLANIPMTERSFTDSNGKVQNVSSIDPRKMVPVTKLDALNKRSAEAVLKLTLLGLLIKDYEPNYDKKEDITIHPIR